MPVNPEPMAMPGLELTAVCVATAEDITDVTAPAGMVVNVLAITELVAAAADVATRPAVVPVPFCAIAICLNIS